MPDVTIKNIDRDEKTRATCGVLHIGRVKAALPNKFPTTSELNAVRVVRFEDPLPGEVAVVGKLALAESFKKLLSDDEYLKGFTRRISREMVQDEEVANVLFLVFRGDVGFEKTQDLRTLLDLQYFADLDVVSVQQTAMASPQDYASLFRVAERWLDQRGLDKPLMPILRAGYSPEEFGKYLEPLLKRKISLIGLDMRGGFYYHTLRALEALKIKDPDIWIHAFQVPPKIRFGRLHPTSQGMLLPYFGVDSFSRWVVPPPPTPLTKDKINVFEREGWGVFKRKGWRELHGNKLGCKCVACKGKNLSTFFDGKVLTALSRSKVHDHYAQQDELRKSADHIKKQTYSELLQQKKFAKSLLGELPQAK